MRRLWLSVAAMLVVVVCGGDFADCALAAVPSVTSSFGPSSIALDGSASLSIAIGNPNGSLMTGVGFTDSLPSGLVVAAPSGLSNDCGGTATAIQGSSSVSLSGGSISASTLCDVSLNVVGITPGQKDNTVTVGSSAGSSNPSSGSVSVGTGPPSMTVGSPLISGGPATFICGNPTGCTFATSALGGGGQVTSPFAGRLVRWRIVDDVSGTFAIRVLHPAGGGQYTATGASSPVTVTSSSGALTYVTDLPIQAGDLVGVDMQNGNHLSFAMVTGSSEAAWFPILANGATAAPGISTTNSELLYNADVEEGPPGLTGLSPASGSISGGTSVRISGHELLGATSVKFGNKQATGFTVDSNGQITATSPSGSAPGPVDVSVTTGSGSTAAVAADQFTYTACVVPKVKGKTPKAAKKKLVAAGCKLGKRKGHGDKVKKQGTAPGSVLPPGTAVTVKLG